MWIVLLPGGNFPTVLEMWRNSEVDGPSCSAYNSLQNVGRLNRRKEKSMKVREALSRVRTVRIPRVPLPVEETVAEEVREVLCPDAKIVRSGDRGDKPEEGIFCIAVVSEDAAVDFFQQKTDIGNGKEKAGFDIGPGGTGFLAASHTAFLYAAFSFLVDNLLERDVSETRNWFRPLTFGKEKSTFDLFLTQYARLIRDFQREPYIREYARLGFTHIEVNALACDSPAEEKVPGEFYSQFYTYCPSLDQFVDSRLNRGIYPEDYLASNLNLLKRNAETAQRFGLVPGLLCFEPRSVPETFFQRYPTLRGARVDHPFRSFKPRYSLALAHPLVKRHYQELLTKLLMEVPQLGFLTIWSNDSGAGFEHTKSLYVGRNGGAYLIREWKSDETIARSAAKNIIDFFRSLLGAADSVRPGFRVITRLESFYGERRFLWPELKDGIDVEANSLLTRGWESKSFHPLYRDIPVLGSALHNSLQSEEKEPLNELRQKKTSVFFYHFFSSHGNHEPLLGIPFPWLVFEKLKSCAENGIDALAHVGGLQPPDKVPFAVNQEVFRFFQFDSHMDIDRTVADVAERYAGAAFSPALVRVWRLVDRSVRSFVPLSIYTHYGVVWQRLFARPLVPDIGRIPEEERAYYENFMCTSVHNPNRIDLGQDVLFRLVTGDYARQALTLIDGHVWSPLDEAVLLCSRNRRKAAAKGERRAVQAFDDLEVRTRALRCLFTTLRNTAAWIFAVHRYMEKTDPGIRSDCRRMLTEVKNSEIQNTRRLIDLWKSSGVEWMIVSGTEETPFIYGKSFPRQLEEKIRLMEKYGDREPNIDPEYMFRVTNNPYSEEGAELD
jgi:hypothetical protein